MARPRKNPVEVPGQEKTSSTPAAETDTTSTETNPTPAAAEQDGTSTPAAAEHQPDFDMSAASADEICDRFLQYGFTDNHGHALEDCADFLQLVELATNPVVIVQQPEPEAGGVPATATTPAAAAVNSARPGGPVLTQHGWLVK